MQTRIPFAAALILVPLAYGQTGKGTIPSRETESQGVAERIAIVVGVSDYPDDIGVGNLPFAKNDAEDVAAALKKLGYVVNLIPNARASYVVHEIRESRKLISGTNSTILFYFSGHGASDANHQNYLMTYGAGRERLEKEALSLDELQAELRNTKAQRQVIWIDACRTVPQDGRRSPPEVETFADMKASSGIRILLATSFGEASWEYPELKHGAFTYQLLKALEPGSPAYRDDGVVTFSGLYRYVRGETMKWTYEHHHVQVPVEAGADVTGDFLLASAVVSRPPVNANPNANPGPATLPASATVEATFKLAVDAQNRKDFAEAAKLYRTIADQGDMRAQAFLGGLYDGGEGVTQSYTEAAKWYRLAGNQGFSDAQTRLGWLYDSGLGVARDDAEAAKWYRLAANQGDVFALANLGWMYRNGRGVPQDAKEAVSLLQQAADKGNATALANLGWMYYAGEGVQQSYTEAAKWFRAAADKGNSSGQANLGHMYYNGEGVTRSYPDALKWTRLGADQGLANAQKNLGVMYEDGLAVTKSVTEALKWYKLAAAQGDDVAKKAVARLSAAK